MTMMMIRFTPAAFGLAYLLLFMETFAYPSAFPECPNDGGPSFSTRQDLGPFPSEGDVEAPSPAPSMTVPCSSSISNARGSYSTTRAPCIFEFHNSTDNETDYSSIKYRTSELCSSENTFLTIKDYVDDWSDECVGDFARCYSIEYHQSILLDFVCSKGWEIPNGTTHISVDCRDDKMLVLESVSRFETEQVLDHKTEKLEQVESKLFDVVLAMSCFVVAVFSVSKWIIKPLVMLRGPCRHGSCQCQHGPSCLYHETLALTRDTAITSSLTRETTLSSMESSSTHEEQGEQNEEESENFHIQVPADFDAVPIVPATAASQPADHPAFPISAHLATESDSVPFAGSTSMATTDHDGVPIAAATVIPDYR